MFGFRASITTGWNAFAIGLMTCLVAGLMSQNLLAQTDDKSKTVDPFETIDPVQDKKVDKKQDPFKDPFKDPFGAPPEDAKKSTKTAPKVEQQKDPFKKGDPADDPATKKSDPFGAQNPATNPNADTSKTGTPQSNDSNPSKTNAESKTAKQQTSEFDDQFWRYLSANNYKNWAPVPGKSGDFYDGRSPHGAKLKMYLNRTAAGNPSKLPNGSVVIKENYDTENNLKAITVMYRSQGYNPSAGDWYWIKYNPDGTVATTSVEMGSARISGAFKSCIECHAGAEGNDYSFFNDK